MTMEHPENPAGGRTVRYTLWNVVVGRRDSQQAVRDFAARQDRVRSRIKSAIVSGARTGCISYALAGWLIQHGGLASA
jgi:hypothetical protein